jgi:hypothetical protein
MQEVIFQRGGCREYRGTTSGTSCWQHLFSAYAQYKHRVCATRSAFTTCCGRLNINGVVSCQNGLLYLLHFGRRILGQTRRRASIHVLIYVHVAHPAQVHLGGGIAVEHDGDAAVAFGDNAIMGKHRAVRHQETYNSVWRDSLHRSVQDYNLANYLVPFARRCFCNVCHD